MQKKYNSQLVPFARQLRSEMTKEERHLWYDFLRTYPIRFSRQKVLGKYIADFYSAKVGLVIELDGSQHYEEKNMEADAARTAFLEGYDLKVIRIPNNEIAQNFRGVCEYIDSVVKQRLKAPLGHKGPIPPIRGKWPEGPIGVGTLSAKRTEGIRTLQISEHSEIYTRSPPSFSPKMPPPLIMQGMTRGGFSGCRLGFSQASFSSFSLAFFSAFASWSGQEVSFMPQ